MADFMAAYNIGWVGRSVIKRLRRETFAQLLKLPSGYYDSMSSGMLLSKITYNIEQVAEATTNVITVLVRDGLTIVGLIAVIADPEIARMKVTGTVVGGNVSGWVASLHSAFGLAAQDEGNTIVLRRVQ